MKTQNKITEKWDLPLGFARALSENTDALKAFVSLPIKHRESCIELARSAGSESEMKRLAQDIAEIRFVDFI